MPVSIWLRMLKRIGLESLLLPAEHWHSLSILNTTKIYKMKCKETPADEPHQYYQCLLCEPCIYKANPPCFPEP